MKRFTTYERIEERLPLVVKKDDRRESYDRSKILAGIMKACEKRPVSLVEIEKLVDGLEARLLDAPEKEIESRALGEMLMNDIKGLDEVAYVRFASVYRDFRDISEFMVELKELLELKKEKV